MPKIDDVEANAKQPRSTRVLKRNTTDKDVKRAIADNLKDMSNEELYSTTDSEGFTCFQRIAERKRLHKEDSDRYPVGANFYKD
jgi:CRISPR/Cas system type I-B associated protein Csh2 (Cas7 group RAMP superfamily)